MMMMMKKNNSIGGVVDGKEASLFGQKYFASSDHVRVLV